MAQTRKFLKLGKAAASFHDAATEINLANDAVVEVNPDHLDMPHIAERLRGGHIVETNEAAFEKYQAKVDKLVKESNKLNKKKKLALLEVDDDDSEEDTDDKADAEVEDDDDDDDDDDEDDTQKKTKDSMIADLKASPLVKDKEKAGLSKLSLAKLISLHNKITGK